MGEHYLVQVEVANISSLINDTRQLSVRRGASLAMRNLVRRLPDFVHELEVIRKGGSIGIYKVLATKKQSALDNIRDVLNGKMPGFPIQEEILRQLRVTVETRIYKEEEPFKDAIRDLVAKTRYAQNSLVDLITECIDESTDQTEQGVCKLTGYRPSGGKRIRNDPVADSVHARYQYGRDTKNEFILEEAGLSRDSYQFVKDLNKLSSKLGTTCHQKMAVVYFDGNDFTAKQSDFDLDQTREFDKALQSRMQKFLKNLVVNLDRDKTEADEIRLEVLIWGGDEVLLVVPAWAGFATLELFYKTMTDEDNGLSYAGGVVFCHHKTPIDIVSKLAQRLAEQVKRVSREENLFLPILLESENYPLGSLAEYWKQHYLSLDAPPLPTTPISIKSLSALSALRELGIHSELRRGVISLYQSGAEELPEALQTLQIDGALEKGQLVETVQSGIFLLSRLPKNTKLSSAEQKVILEYWNQLQVVQPWIIYLEYWDYLQPFAQVEVGHA